jgi:glucosamine--fructose-6-phosphate aminotransferase (isomerizing)
MLDDIRNQPASLAAVLDHQFGEGRRALTDAAQKLKTASEIVISGMGASHFAAIPLAYWLIAHGIRAQVVEAAELLHYQRALGRNATVVLVSRSGNTIEVAKLIPVLKELGATVIGVTNEPDSTLARDAHLPILVNSGKDEMVAVQTYTGAVLTMMLLAGAATGEPEQKWRSGAETAIGAVGSMIERFVPESAGWRPFVESARVVYVIGRGPSHASVHEGALLFNETARLPSVALPGGTFRHGPVEVVDGNFHAILFAGQEETLDLDRTLAADLQQMGAQVRTVSRDGSWAVPDVARQFLPMVEIIPLQLAAFRAAEVRGIRPGGFRYVTQVTTSETGFLRP